MGVPVGCAKNARRPVSHSAQMTATDRRGTMPAILCPFSFYLCRSHRPGTAMIRITELALPLDHPPEALAKAIQVRLNISALDLLDFTLFKRSYDARKKNSEIKFVYIVDVVVRSPEKVLARFPGDHNINPSPDTHYYHVAQAPAELTERPVVIGFGPCGLFAALTLA